MERTEALQFWNDMWQEGNRFPSVPDSLAGLSAADAAWSPDPKCHSIWQEVVHLTFWRKITLRHWVEGRGSTDEEVEREEFKAPEEVTEEAWTAAVAALKETQDQIAAAIQDENIDIHRVPYHLVHDPYHLGRITQLRAMQGVSPKF